MKPRFNEVSNNTMDYMKKEEKKSAYFTDNKIKKHSPKGQRIFSQIMEVDSFLDRPVGREETYFTIHLKQTEEKLSTFKTTR